MNAPTPSTRISLIAYLRDGDDDAWRELDRTYRPVIARWLKNHDIQSQDAEDIAQEVLLLVSNKVRDFEHNGRVGAFRKWLRTITVLTLQNYVRKASRQQSTPGTTIRKMITDLEDPESELSRQFDQEHDQYVLMRLLDDVSNDFEQETIDAFRQYVLESISAQEVASKAGIGVHAVYMAKSRVLRALRAHAPEWLDDLNLS